MSATPDTYRTAPLELLGAMAAWYNATQKQAGAVAPCSTPRAAVCCNGVAFIAVYGGAAGLPGARQSQLTGLQYFAHTPIEGAEVRWSDFADWLKAHGTRNGVIDRRDFSLVELRRLIEAMPPCETIRMGCVPFTSGTKQVCVLVVDGDGWRVGVAELSPAVKVAPGYQDAPRFHASTAAAAR
jgi:hypothetical protein